MRQTPVSLSSILIVDDEKTVRNVLQFIFRGVANVHLAANAAQALTCLQQHPIDLIFLDVMLPDMNGVELLKQLKQIKPFTRIIMVTAAQEIQTAVNAMKAGAFDFLLKPVDGAHVRATAERALAHQNGWSASEGEPASEKMVGRDAGLRNAYKIIESVSPCESNALIQGVSDTGKRLIARALHNRSGRACGPYRIVDCATVPPALLESALFGTYREGYRGALRDGPGQIERANFGSLFIDNIHHLSQDNQARLMRIIRHQEVTHPTSGRTIQADVRIIAATNQDLKLLANAGLFRADLYKCLNELPINLPLLRERGEAIGLLLEHFLKQHALRNGGSRRHFSIRARSHLGACDWPGNVREFEHLVERLCTPYMDHPADAVALTKSRPHFQPKPSSGLELTRAIRAFERQHILAALKAADGCRSRAARYLGIHRNTLLRKTKNLKIDYH